MKYTNLPVFANKIAPDDKISPDSYVYAVVMTKYERIFYSCPDNESRILPMDIEYLLNDNMIIAQNGEVINSYVQSHLWENIFIEDVAVGNYIVWVDQGDMQGILHGQVQAVYSLSRHPDILVFMIDDRLYDFDYNEKWEFKRAKDSYVYNAWEKMFNPF